jgi:hypothetical protein
MGYSHKRKGSEDSEDEVVTKRSKGGGAVPVKQKDADGNPFWEVRASSHFTTFAHQV